METFLKDSAHISLSEIYNSFIDPTFDLRPDYFGQYRGEMYEVKEFEEESSQEAEIEPSNNHLMSPVSRGCEEIILSPVLCDKESTQSNDDDIVVLPPFEWKTIVTRLIENLRANPEPICLDREFIKADTDCIPKYFNIDRCGGENRCIMKAPAYKIANKFFAQLHFSERFRQSFDEPVVAIDLLRRILNYFFSISWTPLHIRKLERIYEEMEIPHPSKSLSAIVEIYSQFISGDDIANPPTIDATAVRAILNSSTLLRAPLRAKRDRKSPKNSSRKKQMVKRSVSGMQSFNPNTSLAALA